MKNLVQSRNWLAIRHRFFPVTVFIAVGTTPLLGQNPLQVHTQPANAIRASSVELNGMVLPGSNPATVWFEWGTSRRYGSVIGLTNLSAGDSVIALRQALNGLSPDYVYHCRLVASNAAGVIYGADQQFSLGATVLVWGNPDFGKTDVPADLTNAVAVGGGGYHCVALRNDGTIAAWGGNAHGQTDVPPDLTNAVAIAVGQGHSLALLSDGTVRAWGAGTTFNPNPGPTDLEGGQSIVPAGLSNVVQIAAGVTHSLALKADGGVAAWGSARIFSNVWTPLGQAAVPAGLSNVVALSGGDFHSMALKADGTVVVWGDATYEQANIPPGLDGVVAIKAGWYHNLALKSDGTVVAWGLGTVDNGSFPYFGQAIVPPGLSNVAGIAGGGFYSLAFQVDGTAIGWGDKNAGQTDVPPDLQNTVVAIAAGFDFSLALQSSAPIEVSLTILPVGDQIQLNWLGGILQSAGDVNGLYTNMTGATSPLVFTPTETQQFYRVKVQQ